MTGPSSMGETHAFRCVGSEAPYLDAPEVNAVGRVVIGRYGGNMRGGAEKNEDGALVWCANDGTWELAVLLDAHFSAESAEITLAAIEADRAALTALMGHPPEVVFPALHSRLLAIFTAPSFALVATRRSAKPPA
jgi:hypothetical protein